MHLEAYFDLSLDVFGFAAGEHLDVARDLLAGARLARAQFDVASDELIATCGEEKENESRNVQATRCNQRNGPLHRTQSAGQHKTTPPDSPVALTTSKTKATAAGKRKAVG
jgi:hypothetical protein